MNCTVTKDGKTVAEWEGILDVDSGQMLFLNASTASPRYVILLTCSNINLEGDSRAS